ncbi:unnamed protein product [Urochloa humidicola]
MDPKTSFVLKVKLMGNHKKVRQDVSCYSFGKDVDSDTTNLRDLIDEIVTKFPPGYLEVTHVQYYNGELKTFRIVRTDQELMSMFEKHSNTKFVHMFISYTDPSELFQPITEWEGYASNGPSQCSATT